MLIGFSESLGHRVVSPGAISAWLLLGQTVFNATIMAGSASHKRHCRWAVRPLLEKQLSGLVALAVLIAIAGVLVSPAVPSAPTLLPVGVLLLAGLIIASFDVAVHTPGPLLALLGTAEEIGLAAGRKFASAGLPLRR